MFPSILCPYMVLPVSCSLLVQLVPAMCLDYVPAVPHYFCLFIVCPAPAPDRTADLNSKRHPLTSFCFVYLLKFFNFVPVSVPWQGSHSSSSRPSPLQVGVGVGRGPFKSAVHREIAIVRGSFKPVVNSEVHTSYLPFHPSRAPLASLLPECPQEPLLPECPPEYNLPKKMFWGGGATRYSPRSPLIRHVSPNPRIGHSRLSTLLPGSGTTLEASCPVSMSLEASKAPPLDVARHETRLLGGGGRIMSDLFPLV